jgi:rubredoxin
MPEMSLTLQDSYRCPICRYGKLNAMVMMDAFSCDFCRHIFSVNLEQQILRVEDRVPKTGWRWQNDRWTTLKPLDVDLSILVWITSIFLVTIPSGMIGLSAYVFPPIGGLMWNSFSIVWAEITFSVHFLIATWLLVEHYQLPSYVAARIAIDRLLERVLERLRSINA